MKGGEALVETLLAFGVDTAFAVPGESYLPVLAAIQRSGNRIRLVTPRHESGVTFAAEAYGKLMGRPAAGFVSRGPGATNASIGVHTAAQDSTPLVLFIGHVPTHAKGREAFQEIDYHRMFSGIAKAVLEPETPASMAALTARALTLAVSGRPGPVIMVMPKDITEGDAGEVAIPKPRARAVAYPDPGAIAEAARLIDAARHPVVISGEMVAFERAQAALIAFAEASGAAVTAAYRRQDTFPNGHPAYIGHLEINRVAFQDQAWAECDLVIAAGSRLDGITTQDFTLIRPDQRLIQIFPDPDVLARWSSEVALAADVGPTLVALTKAVKAPTASRLAWRERVHAAQVDFATPGAITVQGRVDLARVIEHVGRLAPKQSVILTDSGTFARWVHRYYHFEHGRTQAGPIAGAMGYAVPGALGAAMARPDVPAIAFVGDGGFLMTGQELTTAAQHRLPLKVIVCDNNAWGSILVSQQRAYGASGEFGTRLESPDFAMVAKGYGLAAYSIAATAEFPAAFEAALAHDGPALIHLRLDDRDISPFQNEVAV
ncbi:MAG: thiamine pyrophosphate-binding protein [Alphaproteobacteria bacterium]|nr:thiamine pyrophosphate-binding protein [Alphaproteobacteria bacterium]